MCGVAERLTSLLIGINPSKQKRNLQDIHTAKSVCRALIAGVGLLVMIAMLTSCAGLAGGLN